MKILKFKQYLIEYYMIYKLFEILDLDINIFNTMKFHKARFYDMKWKNICEQLNWKFIPTI